MLLSVNLSLPRDARFVSLMRDVASTLMSHLGTPDESAQDILVAVSEACANAVRHATGSHGYDVSVHVGEDGCVIDVIDRGPGLPAEPPRSEADLDAEAGRGLLLMRALVDELQFIREDDGHRLRLTKRWGPERLDLALADPSAR
ncbi:MAG TPA: ATP-binding protein [Egibacteraceae bacterium]